MGIKEFYKWWEHLSLEPVLVDVVENQLATLCLMVSSFGGAKHKHSDFMLRKEQKPKLSNEEYNKQLIQAFKGI